MFKYITEVWMGWHGRKVLYRFWAIAKFPKTSKQWNSLPIDLGPSSGLLQLQWQVKGELVVSKQLWPHRKNVRHKEQLATLSDPAKIEARVQKVGGPLYEWSKEQKSWKNSQRFPWKSLLFIGSSGPLLSLMPPEPQIKSVFGWLIYQLGNVTFTTWTYLQCTVS